MKYLKKFNESISNFDLEEIEDLFIHLIDSGYKITKGDPCYKDIYLNTSGYRWNRNLFGYAFHILRNNKRELSIPSIYVRIKGDENDDLISKNIDIIKKRLPQETCIFGVRKVKSDIDESKFAYIFCFVTKTSLDYFLNYDN